MKPLVLLAAVAAVAYYYYLQHPAVADQVLRQAQAVTGVAPAPAATPRQHYHSPLDAANNHDSAGFYSNEPSERIELTGPGATKAVGPRPTPPGKDDF